MKTYKTIAVSLIVTVFMLASASARASAITWGPATTASADSDVVTNGLLVAAYNVGVTTGFSPLTINTVTFTAVGLTSGMPSGSPEFWNPDGAAFGTASGLSSAYQDMLRSGAEAHPSATLTLTGLTIGHPYLVQLWVDDSRGGGVATRTETLTSTGGNTVQLAFNFPQVSGGAGQFAVGTFFADGANQVINISGSATGVSAISQINAYQLRDLVPEPSTIALLSLGGLLLFRRRRNG